MMNPKIKLQLIDHNGRVLGEACHEIDRIDEINLNIDCEPATFHESEVRPNAERILEEQDRRRQWLQRAAACCGALIADNLAKKEGFDDGLRSRLYDQVKAWKLIGYPHLYREKQ